MFELVAHRLIMKPAPSHRPFMADPFESNRGNSASPPFPGSIAFSPPDLRTLTDAASR